MIFVSIPIQKKQNGVAFAYRDEHGQYFAEAGKADSALKPEQIPDVQDVKVFADKKTGRMLIPDYDLASLGSKKSGVEKEYHKDYGFFRPEEKQVIEGLQKTTHNMVRHGADTENPVGYKFEMSKETPYTAFSADGKVTSIDNEHSYIDYINQRREAGYNHVLNPRTGVEMTKEGKYFLPPAEARMDYEKIDKQITKIEQSGNIEQFKHAKEIASKEIEYKQMEAALPKAVYAMEVEKAEKEGKNPPSFDEFNKAFSQKKTELKSFLHAEMNVYKSRYGVDSPTKAESERVEQVKRAKATESTIEKIDTKTIMHKFEEIRTAPVTISSTSEAHRSSSDHYVPKSPSVSAMRDFFEKRSAVSSSPFVTSSSIKAVSKINRQTSTRASAVSVR